MILIITIMLILSIGRLLNDDFDQILNLFNPAVYKVGDVISTYTYRVGLIKYQCSLAAAVGVFRNAIGFLLIIVANTFAKRMGEYGIW